MKRNKETSIVLIVLFLVSTAGVVDGATNLISNPGFESGTTSWNFYTNGGGTFTAPSPGYEGTKAAKVALSSGGGNIQLFQTGVALQANTRYRLSFAAYSNTGHDMTVRLIRYGAPYTSYMTDFTVNLGTDWQNFSTEFNSTGFLGTVNDGRLMFWLAPFAAAGDNYYIDTIILEKVGVDTAPPTIIGNTPTGTNVPVTTKITVTFSKAMNQTSAQTAFSTFPATTGGFGWSGNMVTYTPGSNFAYNTTYMVTVGTGAKDLAGNNMLSPYSWQLTTISAATLDERVEALETEVAEIKKLLAGVSRNGNDIYIDGANVHIRAGSGDNEGPSPPRLTNIKISPATASVVAGSPQNFISYPEDQFGDPMTATVTWTSSDPSVGTIDSNGLFIAKVPGTTIITAASGTVSETATVTVISSIIKVKSNTKFELGTGDTVIFTDYPDISFKLMKLTENEVVLDVNFSDWGPNPLDVTSKTPTTLYREVRECGTHNLIMEPQMIILGYYMNCVCKSREQEQCYEDGSFDQYYYETCEYGQTGNVRQLTLPLDQSYEVIYIKDKISSISITFEGISPEAKAKFGTKN